MKKSELRAAVDARLFEIKQALSKLDDDVAIDVATLFPAYQIGKDYLVGDRFYYNDDLYRVVQQHTSQADWLPSETPALYVKVAKPGEIEVWKRPTGAHDVYMKGDKVHYPTVVDSVYESTIDNNAYSPDEYPQGWKIVAA